MLLVSLGLGREFDVNIVHRARDVNARSCEEFIAFEIVYLDIVKNEFSNFFRVRESLNPTSIDYFLVEIPQMNIFDISVMRIECEIPNVLVAVSLRRAYALMKRIKSLKLTKYSQMIEHRNATNVVTKISLIEVSPRKVVSFFGSTSSNGTPNNL